MYLRTVLRSCPVLWAITEIGSPRLFKLQTGENSTGQYGEYSSGGAIEIALAQGQQAQVALEDVAVGDATSLGVCTGCFGSIMAGRLMRLNRRPTKANPPWRLKS
jgi:hypothetical protein